LYKLDNDYGLLVYYTYYIFTGYDRKEYLITTVQRRDPWLKDLPEGIGEGSP